MESQTPHLTHARKVCQPAVLIGARIKVIERRILQSQIKVGQVFAAGSRCAY